MKAPKITVVIPAHNRPPTLRRLLKSVESQTHPPSEVIVVDDASREPEGVYSVIREFKGRLRRLTCLRNAVNRGGSASRNRGILAARFPLIALSDDDDEWKPEKLAKLVGSLTRHWKDTDMVYSWLLVKDSRGKTVRAFQPALRGDDLRAFLGDISGSLPNPSATLIKRECLLRTGLFDEKLPACQDWDMWLRLLERGFRCRPVAGFWTLKHLQEARLSNSLAAKRGFFLLAVKHFGLFLRTHPAVFLHLAWFMTGLKLGLRQKWENLRTFRGART